MSIQCSIYHLRLAAFKNRNRLFQFTPDLLQIFFLMLVIAILNRNFLKDVRTKLQILVKFGFWTRKADNWVNMRLRKHAFKMNT